MNEPHDGDSATTLADEEIETRRLATGLASSSVADDDGDTGDDAGDTSDTADTGDDSGDASDTGDDSGGDDSATA